MSSSLEKLVSNLPRKSLKYTSQRFKGTKLDLMVRKGVYPYDSMDSFDKFNDKLPTKEELYSILNDEHIPGVMKTGSANLNFLCNFSQLPQCLILTCLLLVY